MNKFKVSKFDGFFGKNRITVFDVIEMKKYEKYFDKSVSRFLDGILENAMKNKEEYDLGNAEAMMGCPDMDRFSEDWMVVAAPKANAADKPLRKWDYSNPDLCFTMYQSAEELAKILVDKYIAEKRLKPANAEIQSAIEHETAVLQDLIAEQLTDKDIEADLRHCFRTPEK